MTNFRLHDFPKLNLPPRVPCANCGGRINPNVEFQTAVQLCGECLQNYAKIGAILDAHSDRKIRRNFNQGR